MVNGMYSSGTGTGPTRWNGTWVWLRSRFGIVAATEAVMRAAEVPRPVGRAGHRQPPEPPGMADALAVTGEPAAAAPAAPFI